MPKKEMSSSEAPSILTTGNLDQPTANITGLGFRWRNSGFRIALTIDNAKLNPHPRPDSISETDQ